MNAIHRPSYLQTKKSLFVDGQHNLTFSVSGKLTTYSKIALVLSICRALYKRQKVTYKNIKFKEYKYTIKHRQ